ncbi:type IV pili methyl-accepting chemotaxis transducer N-terminal domain-containing protein [Litoribrevibacter euphylliae]|uniref:Type IV pili methyl-accepting chemotaxis transducer N-terminal domain-containing protein n=1 Tax=Litoribrevibacter euphylliae TaxID=1834034 RepID=A0ABV7HKA1_9GAMM
MNMLNSRSIKALIKLLVLTLIPLSFPIYSWGMTDAEAINKSGRQRMLSQRMMKSYLMLGADVKVEVAQKQLDDSVALFEQQFLELRDYAPSEEITNKLDKVESLWVVHRERIIAQPDKQHVADLMDQNLALLVACDQVVKAIEAHANVASAQLVNISGRQRMLSQKIAKAYIALYWKVEDTELKQEFQQAVQLFDESLQTLVDSDLNNEALNRSLRKVGNQWRFSQSGFKLGDDGRYVPTVISVTTESILKKMDQITKQYEELMISQHALAQN